MSLPQLPGGPDPGAPVPRTPVDGFDLEAYARAAARITLGGEPRAGALARLGLDEARWIGIEQTWLLRIAAALMQRDLSLGEAHDAAFAAERAAIQAEKSGR